MAVIRKFGNDQAGQLAALVAYYAFFSIFPLLLVFTTILGFVLQHNSNLYEDVQKSVLGHFPGLQLGTHPLTGNVTALVIGLLASLWGGLGVTNAAQNAFDRIWAVPFKDRPDFLQSRLRGLAAADGPRRSVRRLGRGHRARDHRAFGSGTQDRRVRDHAGGQLRPVRGGLPLPDRVQRPDPLPVARGGGGRGVPRDPPVLRRHLRRARDHPCARDVRRVRDRDRAARVASPARADDPVRGRDQRGRGAQAVAAQSARASGGAGRPGDPARPGQGRGAPRHRGGRGPLHERRRGRRTGSSAGAARTDPARSPGAPPPSR